MCVKMKMQGQRGKKSREKAVCGHACKHIPLCDASPVPSGKCMAWYVFNWAINYAVELKSDAPSQTLRG